MGYGRWWARGSLTQSLTHSARFTSLHSTSLRFTPLHSTQLNPTQLTHSTHSLPQPLSTRPFVSTKDFTCGALRSFILNQMHYIVKHTNEPNLLKSFGCADPSCQTQHRCFSPSYIRCKGFVRLPWAAVLRRVFLTSISEVRFDCPSSHKVGVCN